MFSQSLQTHRDDGTRFKLFPQAPFLSPFEKPETVTVSSPVGSVGPGPSDQRMLVIDPIGKRNAYGVAFSSYGSPYLHLPPWEGDIRPPAHPAAGHFDHLVPGTRAFELAHMYGSVRFVLDVWEGYFGRAIEWHFRNHLERLEIVLLPHVDNAFAGYGFLEIGYHVGSDGEQAPFSLNFDILAHEVGHLILYSEVGIPTPGYEQPEYYGFHESAADLVAMIASLHFESVVESVLETTRGNLYVLNRLNRIAELSRYDQIRLASNNWNLADFATGWVDSHDLSQPLTGAMFDILVDVFHENLLDRGLIDAHTEDLADRLTGEPGYERYVQTFFDAAYEDDPQGFRDALVAARNLLGAYLAKVWPRLDPDRLTYASVANTLIEVDVEQSDGRYRDIIAGNVQARGIGSVEVGPRLSDRAEGESELDHALSARTAVPSDVEGSRHLSFKERYETARQYARSTMDL